MKNVGFRNIWVILILFYLVGCISTFQTAFPTREIQNEDFLDPILIGDEDCYPPCWMGIVPGTTTVDQAIEILTDMEISLGGNYAILLKDIVWRDSSGKNHSLHFFNDTIVWINLRVNDTHLGGIINHIGEPEGFWVEYDDGGYGLEIYFPLNGIIVLAQGPGKGGNNPSDDIYPAMKVSRIRFVAQASDLPSMITSYHASYGEPVLPVPIIHDWQGYGDLP